MSNKKVHIDYRVSIYLTEEIVCLFTLDSTAQSFERAGFIFRCLTILKQFSIKSAEGKRKQNFINFIFSQYSSKHFERVVVGEVDAPQAGEGVVKGAADVGEDVLLVLLLDHLLLLGAGVEQGGRLAVEQQGGSWQGWRCDR